MKLRIEHDEFPESPRDWDNAGTMVCWHNRYNLGDEQPNEDPEEWLNNLADSFLGDIPERVAEVVNHFYYFKTYNDYGMRRPGHVAEAYLKRAREETLFGTSQVDIDIAQMRSATKRMTLEQEKQTLIRYLEMDLREYLTEMQEKIYELGSAIKMQSFNASLLTAATLVGDLATWASNPESAFPADPFTAGLEVTPEIIAEWRDKCRQWDEIPKWIRESADDDPYTPIEARVAEIDVALARVPKDLAREVARIKSRIGKGIILLPLYLYDHSGITMSTSSFSCPWDSGQVGYIYMTMERARKEWSGTDEEIRTKALACLEAEVKVYDDYLTGEVYGYVIEDDEGEEVESCWGFYGEEDAQQSGQEALKYLTKRAA